MFPIDGKFLQTSLDHLPMVLESQYKLLKPKVSLNKQFQNLKAYYFFVPPGLT